MTKCPTLHSYVKAQAKGGSYVKAQAKGGILANRSNFHYLLGFERDNVETKSLKTYIRRLWLAFESSKHLSMPRCLLDPVAEIFSKEVEAQVSGFVEDEDRLALEIAKDPLVVDEKTRETRSAFLEDTARTLLVTRGWGDYLWGSRRFCIVPLVNAKPEPGHTKPPEWPRDQDFIIQTVRYWLAARLQDKLRNSRQAKKIPRVECPEDPDQRRASFAAVFPGIKLDDSEEEAAGLVARESVDIKEEATQSRRYEEYALRRRSTRRRKPSARAIDIGELQSTCTDTVVTKLRPVPQAGQRQCVPAGLVGVSSLSHRKPSAAPLQPPNEHSDDIIFNSAAARMASVAPPSLNRSRGVKRRRTASIEGKNPAKLLPTPARSVITSRVPSKRPRGIHDGPKLASAPDPRVSRCGSNNPGGHVSQITNMVSRERLNGACDSQMSRVIQRRAGSIVFLQDQCGHSTDIPSDPSREEDKGVTTQGLTSRDTPIPIKRIGTAPFVSACGQSTASERVLEVPGQDKAVHCRGDVRGFDPVAVRWNQHASGRRRNQAPRAATPIADPLDIDFTLLGDSGAEESHEDPT